MQQSTTTGEPQAVLSEEIRRGHAAYEDAVAAGAPRKNGPALDWAPYRSSVLRHPTKNPKLAAEFLKPQQQLAITD